MPLDKCNSIMAKATGLISSLFNITLSQDMPFRQLQLPQCLYHGSIKAYLCSLLSVLHYHVGDDLWYVRYGSSVRLGKVQSWQEHFHCLECYLKCFK